MSGDQARQSRNMHGDQAGQSWGVHGAQARGIGDQAISRKVTAARAESRVTTKSKCSICSQNQRHEREKRDVFHKHFSSKYAWECIADETKEEYFCPTCKSVHSSKETTRRKVCLSSSILHEFWAPRDHRSSSVYEGDRSHVDYITIPGGKISDLTNAWKVEYFQDSRPMDVILIAGLNNLIKGYSPEEMLREYDHLVQFVHYQAHKFHPELHNTCTIGTLYYPPQLCWLPGKGECPPGFKNHLAAMQYLNTEIERLNQESHLKSPNFPVFGVRAGGKHVKDVHGNQVWEDTTHHRYNDWREQEVGNMLHLSDKMRMKMGRWVGKYFEMETGNFIQPK